MFLRKLQRMVLSNISLHLWKPASKQKPHLVYNQTHCYAGYLTPSASQLITIVSTGIADKHTVIQEKTSKSYWLFCLLNEVRWGRLVAVASAASLHSVPKVTMPAAYHSIFSGCKLMLTFNQQCQSTEGKQCIQETYKKWYAEMQCSAYPVSMRSGTLYGPFSFLNTAVPEGCGRRGEY